jgi:hypothetical protein
VQDTSSSSTPDRLKDPRQAHGPQTDSGTPDRLKGHRQAQGLQTGSKTSDRLRGPRQAQEPQTGSRTPDRLKEPNMPTSLETKVAVIKNQYFIFSPRNPLLRITSSKYIPLLKKEYLLRFPLNISELTMNVSFYRSLCTTFTTLKI